MTRRIATLSACALSLVLVALALGCGKQPQHAQPPLAQSTRAAMPPMRGDNFFEKGETGHGACPRHFPVRFIDKDTVTIHDKWTAKVAEFKNINLWLRVPAEAATPETEHAYWLVRHTDPQASSRGADDDR